MAAEQVVVQFSQYNIPRTTYIHVCVEVGWVVRWFVEFCWVDGINYLLSLELVCFCLYLFLWRRYRWLARRLVIEGWVQTAK